ncbi:acidic leucine-rich nuclear phosphoprotein 32 family member A-like isoform X1 [Anopheles albimanus]|uniref:acidic leucine-rich nuclear phosphoprotein 32 family member A-like isoform X1 n=1 Tax=Anopheles albimanus TaxID=7167 RepID=UPI00164136B6|nr:acidic leucine-rich nuclear phosphoprotein 32 family member A-like isoform X1 [Anopheles albimanus]XP_035788947.1 acidic leucine-rich nuclear phosphoprotein 32 family member A-like isoform X1 [Anopheles albimanus]
MEKRIILEKRGRTDDQITELILDNCRSTYIDGLTDSFTALETLSLINVGLVSLKNFPKLINLRKLELSDNRISNSLSNLIGSPKLTHLNLSGNRIKDFDELKPLQNMGNLEVLDLFNNQVTLVENYRDKIFQLLPSLKYLDGFDKDFAEAPSDEEEMVDDGKPHPSRFSINGIEIDLDELEEVETRIQQKRCIEKLTINDTNDGLECIIQQLDIDNSSISSSKTAKDGEEEDTCEESDDVSLAYLYNDDLEEDQEDWKSTEGGDDDSDDEEGIDNYEAEEGNSDCPGEEETDGNDYDSEEAPLDAPQTGTGTTPPSGDAGYSNTKAVVSDVRGKRGN